MPPTGAVQFLDTSNGNAVLGTSGLGVGTSALNFLTSSNPPDSDGATAIAVGDFNGDGILDYAVANFNANSLSIFLGDGTGNFVQTANNPATSDNPIALAAGDFNGDGILDLAVVNYGGGTVGILLGDGTGNFTPTASPILTGADPTAITAGDFNQDGKLDLAVANFTDGTVTVLLGDGTGNFTATAKSPETGWSPEAIVTADFNGDGIPDLAVANSCGNDSRCRGNGTVTVLLGDGTGNFTATAVSPAAGTAPNALVAADLNGDGKADLAVANFKGETVTVLLGNGDGTFATQSSPATGNGPYSVAVADFNGDGIPDLVTANYDDNTLSILLGDGKGNFAAMATTPLTGQYPVAVAAGDFNGDGRPDIAVANFYDAAMTVLLTEESQTASAMVSGIAPVGAGAHQVAAAYAGDGNFAPSTSATAAIGGQVPTTTALAVTAAGSAVGTVPSGTAVTLTATVQAGGAAVTTGAVNFCDAAAADCTDIHLLGTAELTNSGAAGITLVPGVGSHSYKAVFMGTTAGGAPGIVSTSSPAALTVTGTLPTATLLSESGNVGNYTLTATVTGAGVAAPTGPVAFTDSSNGNALLATILLESGPAGLEFLNASTQATGANPVAVAAGDFNGDGIPDLAVADRSAGTLTILLGDGTGNYSAAPGSVTTGAQPVGIASGDFNRDGTIDLAVTNSGSNSVTVLLGNGDGTFTAAAASPATGASPAGVVAGDFNGDGIPDLAVTNSGSNSVTVLLGNGDGTFTAAPSSPSTGAVPAALATADFNGDGRADLAVTNSGSNSVTVLLGNGDGTFTAASANPATGASPASIAAADFNADGKADLAIANSGSGSITVLLGNGDGTFAAAASPAMAAASTSIAAGDFNGDGKADFAAANPAAGTVTVFTGNGDGTFTQAAVLTAAGAASLAVADLNGDGKADLAALSQAGVAIELAQNRAGTAMATGIEPVGTGTHQIAATYGGDINYLASNSGVVGLTAKLLPPGLTLAASSYDVGLGTPVTFTANVIGNSGPPRHVEGDLAAPMATRPVATGTTTFYAGAKVLGSTTLNSLGQAIFSTGNLPSGTNSVTAHYSGDKNYAAIVSSPVTVTVKYKPLPTVRLAPSAASITYGAPVTLTASLTPPAGGAVPTGSVAFFNGTLQLGTAALSSTGAATYKASYLPGGRNSLTAAYLGNAGYGEVSSAASVVTVSTVAPSVTLASSANSTIFGAAVTLTATVAGIGAEPTGTVTFFNGSVSLGTGPLNGAGVATLATGALPAGTDRVTVSYAGDTNYSPASSSGVTVTVAPKSTPTARLAASASAITYGTPVTLTATIAGSGPGPPAR